MVLKIYTILDSLSAFTAPVAQDNDGVAMRNFQNACCDKSSVFYTHSADYSLWCIGSFDTDTGELIPETARKICTAFDFVSSLNNDN